MRWPRRAHMLLPMAEEGGLSDEVPAAPCTGADHQLEGEVTLVQAVALPAVGRPRAVRAATLLLGIVAAAAVLWLVLHPRGSRSSDFLQTVELATLPLFSGHIRSHGSGLCLDWGPPLPTGNVIIWCVKCNASRAEQKWTVDALGRVVRVMDGRCLDSSDRYLHVWKCRQDPSPMQKWIFADGMLSQQKGGSDDHCLEASRNQVRLERCDKAKALQHWVLESTPGASSSAPPMISSSPPVTSTSQPIISTPTVTAGMAATTSRESSPALEPVDMPKEAGTMKFQIQHSSNLCVETGFQLHLVPCSRTDRSQYLMAGTNSERLWNYNGHCLDAMQEGLLSNCRDGVEVRSQAWTYDADSAMLYSTFRNETRFLCLAADPNRTSVFMDTCDPVSAKQKWTIINPEPSLAR